MSGILVKLLENLVANQTAPVKQAVAPTPPLHIVTPPALQPPAGSKAPNIQLRTWRLQQYAIASSSGQVPHSSLMYEFEEERSNLADLSADLTGTALDALRVDLEEHAAVLQQFMGDPKRPTLDRWAPPR